MSWLWSAAVALFWRAARSVAWGLIYDRVKAKAKEWAASVWRWM